MKENGDVWKELLSQKAEVLRGIAGPSDNAKLRIWTEWLSRELDLEAKHKGLLLEAERLIAERQQPVVEIPGSGAQLQLTEGKTKNEWTLADLPKRERARLARDVYFARQKEKGKNYRKVRRIYYRSDEGIVAGITFSSDTGEGRPFFNLKEGEFQDAVLLFQTGPRLVKAIHLPGTFIQRYSEHLSKDGKGMIKFNFLRDVGKWLLLVPQPVGPVDVTSYVDQDELICTRKVYE